MNDDRPRSADTRTKVVAAVLVLAMVLAAAPILLALIF
jgi:hypothetical protein